jgi:hypothetical protein
MFAAASSTNAARPEKLKQGGNIARIKRQGVRRLHMLSPLKPTSPEGLRAVRRSDPKPACNHQCLSG